MKTIQHNIYYLLLIAFVSLMWINPIYAVSLDKRYDATLYESKVKVDDKKSENELINLAFAEVLVKVSGRSDIVSFASYSKILKQSKNLISQFKYEYEKAPVEAENNTENQHKQKWFWVKFESKSVDKLLKEENIPIWTNMRPVTLLWFSQQQDGQRLLLSQSEAPDIYDVFKTRSKQRGISFIFPFLDLQDQSSISANDIWGNFTDTIILASRRYQSQATVTTRLQQQNSGEWLAQWNLLLLGKTQQWTNRGKNKAQVLLSGVDTLADKLAQQFTSSGVDNDVSANDTGSNTIIIQVSNVSGYSNFQQLDRYLNTLASARHVALLKVQQDNVIYKIKFLGNKNTLIQEIKSGERLNPIEHKNSVVANDFNDNKDYKEVILDDVAEETPSNNEIASSEDKKSLDAHAKQSSESIPVPKVEAIVPDLEYWFVH